MQKYTHAAIVINARQHTAMSVGIRGCWKKTKPVAVLAEDQQEEMSENFGLDKK